MSKNLFKALLFVSILLLSACAGFYAVRETRSAAEDAIGLRTAPNPKHLSPQRWYRENVLRKGNPQSVQVDGYEGVREGRTFYVHAGNVSGNTLHTNIYILSYNQDSSDPTRDIAGELIKKWKFNNNMLDTGLCSGDQSLSCRVDSDCGEKGICRKRWLGPPIKAEIVRDVRRLADISDIEELLTGYFKKRGLYPKLDAGSYMPGYTLSVWPSWKSTFAKNLGASLPTDPINKLGACTGYEERTCWNEEEKRFAAALPSLPASSSVYMYESSTNGNSYLLCAYSESGLPVSGSSFCNGLSMAPTSPEFITDTLPSGLQGAEYAVYISAIDRDGDPLTWQIDYLGTDWSSWMPRPILRDAGPRMRMLYSPAGGNAGSYPLRIILRDNDGNAVQRDFTISVRSYCGDGVLQAGEQCDGPTDGSGSGPANPYSCDNCRSGGWAGDGVCQAAQGEQCDGADFCNRTCLTMGYAAGNLACNNNTISTSSCSLCGNNVIEPGEQCDGYNMATSTCQTEGFFTGSLACRADCTIDDSTCHNCGNNRIDPGEACDGAAASSTACQAMGYYGGIPSCRADCTAVDTTCYRCENANTTHNIVLGEGSADGVVYSGNPQNILSLANMMHTPYIWIANSSRDESQDASNPVWVIYDRVSKIRTYANCFVSAGQYLCPRKTANGWDYGSLERPGDVLQVIQVGFNPSRTAVNLETGDVWVANRGTVLTYNSDGTLTPTSGIISGSISKLGFDSEGNHVVKKTCLENHYATFPLDSRYQIHGGYRGVAIEDDGDAWVAGCYQGMLYKLSGDDWNCQILDQIYVGPDCPYGLAVDAIGNIWVSHPNGYSIKRVNIATHQVDVFPVNSIVSNASNYGITVDGNGNAWGGEWTSGQGGFNMVRAGTPGGMPALYIPVINPGYNMGVTGVSVDSLGYIWGSNYYNAAITRVDPNSRTILGWLPSLGSYPHGICGDSADRIWSVNMYPATGGDRNITVYYVNPIDTNGYMRFRVNPTEKVYPYTYSDMTGLNRGMVIRTGTWLSRAFVKASGAMTAWGDVAWTQNLTAANQTVVVQVRTANTAAMLPYAPWISSSEWNSLPAERKAANVLQVRVTLRSQTRGLSPTVSNLQFVCN